MKRKTLWAFAIILWLLIFSTLFSLWTEQTMVPEVVLTQPNSRIGSRESTLPLDCLTQDEEGNFVIYQMIEGTGWEEGNRAYVLEPRAYSLTPEHIELQYSSGTIIRYATKTPRPGELITPLSRRGKRPDQWLVISRGGTIALKEDAEKTYPILARTDQAILVSAERASTPFMPGEAMSELFETDPFGTGQKKIYSLAEMQKFAANLQLLALAPGLALLVLILWAYSGALIKSPIKSRAKLLFNGGLSVAALLAIELILRAVSLPSSLLPSQNIVELSHYSGEFSEIFAALHTFAAGGNQIAATALSNAQTALWASLAVMLAGGAMGIAIVAIEFFVNKKRNVKYACCT